MDMVRLGCEQVRLALSTYYYSGLTDEWLASVERHLLRCQPCLDEYASCGELLDHIYTLRTTAPRQ
jgi:hypothetical protein